MVVKFAQGTRKRSLGGSYHQRIGRGFDLLGHRRHWKRHHKDGAAQYSGSKQSWSHDHHISRHHVTLRVEWPSHASAEIASEDLVHRRDHHVSGLN